MKVSTIRGCNLYQVMVAHIVHLTTIPGPRAKESVAILINAHLPYSVKSNESPRNPGQPAESAKTKLDIMVCVNNYCIP